MIIVTPAPGWPEPRPQHLITGDRAVQVLDTVTSSALQKSGVKLVTVTGASFQQMIAELIPEVMDGLDPITGRLMEEVIPTRLSPTAIADVDLRGDDGKIEETFIPARLSATALNALLNGVIATVVELDPDGTPVILAGDSTIDDWTVTGNSTLNDVTAATLHADIFTSNQIDIVNGEADTLSYVGQTIEPGNPSAGKYKLYADINGRFIWRDSAGAVRRLGNKRIVTSWPSAGESYLGDEAINSTTGEHRIYLGTTKGWRLTSQIIVNSLAERNALTATAYAGMRVFCQFGTHQDHIFQSDNKWHGTKTFFLDGAAIQNPTVVYNDSNYHDWTRTAIVDPGYEYYVSVQALATFYQTGGRSQVELGMTMTDPGTVANAVQIAYLFDTKQNPIVDPDRYNQFHMNATSGVQAGARDALLSWRAAATQTGTMAHPVYTYQKLRVTPA